MAGTVLVTGATGLIGGALVRRLLERGDPVRVLVRDPVKARRILPGQVDIREWHGNGSPLSPASLQGLGSVVHLAGEPIAGGRWSEERKHQLVDSRVRTTQTLVEGLRALAPDERPGVFVCGSAIGIYGDRKNEILDDDAAPGKGFLAELCVKWEAASSPLDELGIRRVNLRTGIVLSREGGALVELLRVFRLGLGGPLGSGLQWMSWIHLDDLVSAIVLLLAAEPALRGPVNAVAPGAVTNREFSHALGRALARPAILRAPGFALKLALGEMAGVLLEGQRVRPVKLESSGFRFRFPELQGALADLLRAGSISSSSPSASA